MATSIDNDQASLALTQLLPTAGVYPSRDIESSGDLGAYITLGSLRTFAGNFPIGESAAAEGQVQSINQNQALFSLLGTRYGGDGTHTFALPNLAGRTAVGAGQGPGLPNLVEGQEIGSATVTLSTAQLPSSIGGGGQPYNNYQPSLALKYLIDVEGRLPSEGAGTTGVGFIGAVVPSALSFVPNGYLEAAGQLLDIAENDLLFSVIGTSFGGDGQTTFALPDLRGRTVTGAETPGAVAGQPFVTVREENLPIQAGGSGLALENREPSLGLTYLISVGGVFPENGRPPDSPSPDEQYLGEVIAFAGNYAPAGWALAQGQLLPIAGNQALFSILGTTYGGDGQTTFALPDLNNRTVVGTGAGVSIGDRFGSNLLILSGSNISDPAPDLASYVAGTSSDDVLR
jgi:microcystin-dependent protein